MMDDLVLAVDIAKVFGNVEFLRQGYHKESVSKYEMTESCSDLFACCTRQVGSQQCPELRYTVRNGFSVPGQTADGDLRVAGCSWRQKPP